MQPFTQKMMVILPRHKLILRSWRHIRANKYKITRGSSNVRMNIVKHPVFFDVKVKPARNMAAVPPVRCNMVRSAFSTHPAVPRQRAVAPHHQLLSLNSVLQPNCNTTPQNHQPTLRLPQKGKLYSSFLPVQNKTRLISNHHHQPSLWACSSSIKRVHRVTGHPTCQKLRFFSMQAPYLQHAIRFH
jgi:hypothetical protein